MREQILDVLARGELLLSDGSMGAMLDRAGLPPGTVPEAWNLDEPEQVAAIHRAYRRAGAQILTTNTIGGNRLRLADAGLGEHTAEINRRAAALAREAAGDDLWVAGSVGPTGQLMAPYGALTPEAARAVFAEQAEALAAGGVDVILMETHYDLAEVLCGLEAIRTAVALPVFCTFAFNPRGRTMMGLAGAEAARRTAEAGAAVVGANCGDGPAAVLAGLAGMAGITDRPLMAQANAGLPRAGAGQAVWDVTPEQMAAHAREYVALGARIVGGCCGTDPAHIAAMGRAMRALG